MAAIEPGDPPSGRPAVLPRAVRLALEAVRAEPARPFPIADLAAAAGSTPRTLQRQFRAFLGKTPGAAVRDLRFERARRDLLQGAPGATVTEVALRCGLSHLGRFAIEYRRRYGETPSQTLRRGAALLAERAPRAQPLPDRYERPLLAVGPIEASDRDAASARDLAEELTAALVRAGIAVTSRPLSARYRLLGRLRRDGRQTRTHFSADRCCERPLPLGASLRRRRRRPLPVRGAGRRRHCWRDSAEPARSRDRARAAKGRCRSLCL